MITRDWFFNPERESAYFDIKFTLSAADINFDSLTKDQWVNHFKGSACITTKAGLIQTLSNSLFHSLTYPDKDDFLPRCYDLALDSGMQDFLCDYHCLQAETTLARLLQKYEIYKYRLTINPGILKILLNTIRKDTYRHTSDSAIDSPKHAKSVHLKIQYMIIQQAEEWLYRTVVDHDFFEFNENMKGAWFDSTSDSHDTQKPLQKRIQGLTSILDLRELTEIDLKEITLVLTERHDKSNKLQALLNGTISNNLWILKPSGKSRGRGITVAQSIAEIYQHIRVSDVGKSSQWVIQKYMENPLTIAGRKFDIRQWVLITGK